MPTRVVFVLFLAAGLSSAAPVPKPAAPDPAEMERLWKQFRSGSDIELTRAVCRLLAVPDAAVQLLTAKLRPLTLTGKQAERLIGQLGSETEWKEAFEELLTFDPRLALSLDDCWALAKTDDQKRRLAWVFYGEVIEGSDESTFDLRPPAGKDELHVLNWLPKPGTGAPGVAIGRNLGSIRVEKDVAGLRMTHRGWERNAHAVLILARIGTPAAWQQVKALATGHKDAAPTLYAKWMLETRDEPKRRAVAARPVDMPLAQWEKENSPAVLRERDFRRRWDALAKDHSPGDRIEAILEFVKDEPVEAVKFLRVRMHPLKLEKKRADELVAKLFSANEAEWKGAVAEFAKTDIRLAYPVHEAWNLTADADQRAKMVMALHHEGARVVEDLLHYDPEPKDVTRLFEGDPKGVEYAKRSLYFTFTMKPGLPKDLADRLSTKNFDVYAPGGFASLNECLWCRHESAVYILDAIGTDDALAIIKDMATGHPDAGPTKAAAEVLKRRKK